MDIDTRLKERAARVAPGTEAPRGVLTDDGRLRLEHEHLDGTTYERIGIADAFGEDGDLTPHAWTVYDDAVRDVARRTRRSHVFARIDQDADMERPWRTLTEPPAWATFTHPLFAYALRMHGAYDMTAEALKDGDSPSAGLRFQRRHDLLIGRATLDPENPKAKVGCDDTGATLEIMAEIPESTRQLLAGRSLGSLLQLRPSGDTTLDAHIANMTITHVTQSKDMPVIMVTTAPVPWIAAGKAPHGTDVSTLRRDAPSL